MKSLMSANLPVWVFFCLLGYFLVFFLGVIFLYRWKIHRRKERPPEKFKLLRGPGENLRRRVQKADEDLFERAWWAAMLPLLAGCLMLFLAAGLPKEGSLFSLIAACLIFCASLIITGRWFTRHLHRRRDDLLGYLGERAVAEHLEPLVGRGYRIFHDVPVEGRVRPFNLDHVVVGPTGVVIVETKTRRKRPARAGYPEHVVTYDGRQLIWPWGEDRWGLDQVQAEIDWLCKWIEQRTALRLPVKPILAIPGWYVEERALGSVRVTNPKRLPRIIAQWNPQHLTAEQIDLISRQLDERCRDVED